MALHAPPPPRHHHHEQLWTTVGRHTAMHVPPNNRSTAHRTCRPAVSSAFITPGRQGHMGGCSTAIVPKSTRTTKYNVGRATQPPARPKPAPTQNAKAPGNIPDASEKHRSRQAERVAEAEEEGRAVAPRIEITECYRRNADGECGGDHRGSQWAHLRGATRSRYVVRVRTHHGYVTMCRESESGGGARAAGSPETR